ncbi:phage tail protein [Utexia brackfieldae]|uniref:phage tail protein n=1 Tax=Utexia brackfieldae TaxID=3074108 RepID=UPI00370DC344
MSQQTYYTVVTNLGASLLAQAAALGVQVKFSYMAVGDANGTLPKPAVTQTALLNEKRRGAINSIHIDPQNPKQIIIEQVIPPEEGGWDIREIGVFDDKGNLIAVGNCPPSYKPVLSEGSGRTQIINVVIIVDNASSVELKIDASTVLATRKYVDNVIAEHEKSTDHPDASISEKGFVQLNSAINSTAENQAATPKAVKIAYDLASTAKTIAETDASTTVKGQVQLSSSIDSNAENQAATPNAINILKNMINNITSGVYVGEIRFLPFRSAELPAGWYFANGDKYSTTSPVGLALKSLSDNFKLDWGITESSEQINLPTFFYSDGRGFMIRAVNGIDRQVGTIQNDMIRNIIGKFYSDAGLSVVTNDNGVFSSIANSSVRINSAVNLGNRTIVFDASTVVPTGNENVSLNIGMTAAIYLGV